MNKIKTSLIDTQEALETAKYSYEQKLRELQSIEQKAHVAQASGDEAIAKQLMMHASQLEEHLSVVSVDIKYLESLLKDKASQKNLNIISLLSIPFGLILMLGGVYWYLIDSYSTLR